MRLLIDASSINRKNVFASIPNYILHLIDGFLVYSSYEIILLIDDDFKFFFEKRYPTVEKYYLKRNFVLYRIPLLGEIYGRWKYKKNIAKIPHDIEIIASDQDRSTRIKTKHSQILVIHDLKGLKGGCLLQKWRNFFFYRTLVTNAKAVVAISDYTKDDLILFFNVNKDKIYVIPNSVVLSNDEVKINSDVPEEFILYVNTLTPYKNPITLIKAFEQIHNQINHKLIFVGKTTSYWNNTILPYITSRDIQEKIIHLENLDSKELQYLYNRASLFVTTSKREGFGYTPIEAALSKVPTICSLSEALPYSTQGLLNYYKPVDDYNELAKKMLDVLNDPPPKEQLDAIAIKFKEDYSPKRQIEQFCKLIQTLET